MSVSVSMPQLGESVTEGTVTRWLKKEGERVEADEPLLEVSTDKVDTEISSPAAGVVREITVGEDETAEIGAQLAVIAEEAASGDSAEPAKAAPAPAAAGDCLAEAPATTEAAAEPTPGLDAPQQPRSAQLAPDGASPYVTPLVRRLAAGHGVDLESVTGSGMADRIRKQDFLDAPGSRQAAEAQAAAPAGPTPAVAPAVTQPAIVPSALRGTTQRMSRLRQVIAQHMVESQQTSAQLTTVVEADVTGIARLRERGKAGFEAREGVKLSFLPFFALAAVEALKVHPKLNAVIDTANNQVRYHDAEHLGIAVDAERGLMVPVIHNAGDLNLGGLARKIAGLAARTRSGEVSPDELAGGTFTLTNTGSRGALFDTPIINQPQVGILGTGTVVKRPVVVEAPALGEVIAVRSVVYLALTYDHRLVDGADAARFLGAVKDRLEEGAFEPELGL